MYYSSCGTPSGFLVYLTILAREWGNAHTLLYVTMATATLTDRDYCA